MGRGAGRGRDKGNGAMRNDTLALENGGPVSGVRGGREMRGPPIGKLRASVIVKGMSPLHSFFFLCARMPCRKKPNCNMDAMHTARWQLSLSLSRQHSTPNLG